MTDREDKPPICGACPYDGPHPVKTRRELRATIRAIGRTRGANHEQLANQGRIIAELRVLCEAQADYIELLEKASGSGAAFMAVHGVHAYPGDVQRGRELRQAIADAGGAPFHD